jgi:hypothetical protein
MDLILLVLVLVLIGFIVWILTTRVPMPPLWATTIQVIALVALVTFLLSRVLAIPNVLR